MTETVLTLPLIFVVLGLLFYFGDAMLRLQRATNAARYAVWQDVGGAPGLSTDAQVRDGLMGKSVTSLKIERGKEFPTRADNALVDQAGREDADNSDAANLVRQLLDAFPTGRSARVTVTHKNDLPMSDLLEGPMVQRQLRIGNDWKFVNGWRLTADGWEPTDPKVTPADTIRKQVFTDFDNTLAPYASSGNPLAQVLRDLYLQYPAYRGPTVPLEWVGTPWGW